MSDQPPYQPPYQPQSQQGWQNLPPSYGQQPYPPAYSPSAGTPTGGPPRKTPWGLVVGALVAGLVIGAGAGTSIVLATAGDPKDSDEYQALEDDLGEARASLDGEGGTDRPTASGAPTSPSEEVTPETSDATRDVDGWTVTEPVIFEDEVGDFSATLQVTNDTGADDIAFFKVTLSDGGTLVTEMSCADEVDGASEVLAGESAALSCLSLVDYVDDSWTSVDVTYGFS